MSTSSSFGDTWRAFLDSPAGQGPFTTAMGKLLVPPYASQVEQGLLTCEVFKGVQIGDVRDVLLGASMLALLYKLVTGKALSVILPNGQSLSLDQAPAFRPERDFFRYMRACAQLGAGTARVVRRFGMALSDDGYASLVQVPAERGIREYDLATNLLGVGPGIKPPSVIAGGLVVMSTILGTGLQPKVGGQSPFEAVVNFVRTPQLAGAAT